MKSVRTDGMTDTFPLYIRIQILIDFPFTKKFEHKFLESLNFESNVVGKLTLNYISMAVGDSVITVILAFLKKTII